MEIKCPHCGMTDGIITEQTLLIGHNTITFRCYTCGKTWKYKEDENEAKEIIRRIREAIKEGKQ